MSSFKIDDFSGGKDLNGKFNSPSYGASTRFSPEDASFILSFSSSKSALEGFSLEDVSLIFYLFSFSLLRLRELTWLPKDNEQ